MPHTRRLGVKPKMDCLACGKNVFRGPERVVTMDRSKLQTSFIYGRNRVVDLKSCWTRSSRLEPLELWHATLCISTNGKF